MTLPTQTRILLIGHSGQVGWELRRTIAPLGEIRSVDYPEIDLANADSIRRCVRQVAPMVVVNAAAYTAVDRAESEAVLAHRINAEAPGILAEEALRLGAWLVHYSTDYVFDGRKSEPYEETDVPNPLGEYGRSKWAGEQAVQQVGGDFLIWRLCWVYGARGGNFLRTIRRLALERETLRVVGDQVGSPTWSRWVAEATSLALTQVLAGADRTTWRGLYHLSADGATSWHGFAARIVDRMPTAGKKCRSVDAIPTVEYPTPAPRPAYSVLNCTKLFRVFGLHLPNWEEGLERVCEELGWDVACDA